eukprot:CAMPEP_0205946704 /NCGR_PEP_ID=MMETSP1325-20131115/69187_1 /ASSEMBLY_ACC=CAM_ASM_000708 /TAXON_ID=236786 /ORGANISM="Florenciella sp., Strain RCC1007" /LENGTH=170 /DNA_ID=CAMNT_0053317793 /DNA_START=565 /DNA_END=1077 /DNA_ORIENTATION=-
MPPPSKETIERLCSSDEGYGKEEALEALLECNGSEEDALEYLRSASGAGDTLAALPDNGLKVGDVDVTVNKGHRRDPTISGPIAHIDHLTDPDEIVPLEEDVNKERGGAAAASNGAVEAKESPAAARGATPKKTAEPLLEGDSDDPTRISVREAPMPAGRGGARGCCVIA